MKTLEIFYKLLLSSFKKNTILFLSIFLFISTTLNLNAASENINNPTLITLPYTENDISLNKSKSNYFQFTLTTAGNVSVKTTGASIPIIAILDGNTVTGTSNIDMTQALSSGTYLLEIKNPSSTTTVTYSIAVSFSTGNRAPIANDNNYKININGILTGNIITDTPADSDPDGDSISIASENSTGDINITSDGNFTYRPATDFCGVYTFDYAITDGSLISNTAKVTINIQNILTPVNDFFVTGISTALTQNLLINDNNPTYTVSSHTSPSHGTVTVSSDGTFTYTPTVGYSGQDSFTYTVTDGTCSVATATVTISVTNMCAHATAYTLCSGSITPTITAGTPVAYYFTLPADAILDLNLTNTGNKELQYDFQEANCGALFTGDTTSYLPQGDGIHIVKKYAAGTYYIGFNVGQVSTTIDLSICYDTNLSGGGDSYVNTNVGVNERNIDYDTDKNITTKIVNKSFGVRTSYLDGNGNVATYDGEFGQNKSVDMSVILALADDNCNQPTPNEVIGQTIILDNTSYTDQAADAMTIDYASRARRIAMTSFDFGNLFREASGLNCANSSLQSSLCLVPACFNSPDNIKAVFPPAFYPQVNVCVNGDDPTKHAPCDSNAYSGNCGGRIGTISPPQYNTDLGCAQCLADAFEGEPCSKDNFAIRPKNFDVNISDGETFISGNPTNLKFEAPDWNDITPTTNYNEVEDTSFAVDINFTDITKNCPVTIELEGPVQFNDGIDTNNFYFTDIGKDLNFTVHENNGTEFAVVDADDTNDTDRLITPFVANINIIPSKFVIEANLTDHNSDNNFTYLHNTNLYDGDDNYSMAATLTIDIKAVGADNNITRNYMETCYAQDNNITLGVTGTNITYPGSKPLDYLLYYNPAEDNGSVNSGEGEYNITAAPNTFDPTTKTITINTLNINNTEATFPADAPDGNGTTYIEYKLNFDREEHLLVNPFSFTLSDVNITDTDNVEGRDDSNLTDQQATFQYARSRSSKFFYEDISTQTVNTPIMIDVYCDLSFTACDTLGIDIVNGQTNEVNWWLSLGHDKTGNDDGNIALIEGAVTEGNSSDWSVTPTVNIISNATDPNIIVDRGTGPLPLTVEIELDQNNPRNTDHWLIYNEKYPMPLSPFYKVRFIGTSGWAGHGDTGHVVDSNMSIKKHRRLGW